MRTQLALAIIVFFTASTTSFADAVVSDGSLGPFNPSASQTINLDNVAPDGVLNYTTIHIPAGVTIRFAANSTNTPVFMAATGQVVIDGTIDVSGSGFSSAPGPGGGAGGAAGSGLTSGLVGAGPSPGNGGLGSTGLGNAGGGGGMATEGLIATSRTGGSPASGGVPVAKPALVPAIAGGGGSGGGGGGGRNQCIGGCVALTGGVGGGGGGAVQIATPGELMFNGTLRANGGHGGWAFANIFGHAGPGGGGSGGSMEMYAASIVVGPDAVIEAIGGAGGGLSTEPVPNAPYVYSSGAHGGQGYLLFGADDLAVDIAATIDAMVVYDGDSDADGIDDDADNCVEVANALQRDTDGDGIGNRCDPDIAMPNDCVVNALDLGVIKQNFFAAGDLDSDFDGDGVTNAIDLGILKAYFFAAPGPSGLNTACTPP